MVRLLCMVSASMLLSVRPVQVVVGLDNGSHFQEIT